VVAPRAQKAIQRDMERESTINKWYLKAQENGGS